MTMKSKFILVLLISTILTGCATTPSPSPYTATYEVYFSPDGGCANAIIAEIGKAKTEILVQAYYLTADDIVRALAEAQKRGVLTKVILDNKSNATLESSKKDVLIQAGIRTYLDAAHPISHNKLMVIDNEVVITGSYNFTKNAERNAENIVILRSKVLANGYIHNWMEHEMHSEAYGGR